MENDTITLTDQQHENEILALNATVDEGLLDGQKKKRSTNFIVAACEDCCECCECMCCGNCCHKPICKWITLSIVAFIIVTATIVTLVIVLGPDGKTFFART